MVLTPRMQKFMEGTQDQEFITYGMVASCWTIPRDVLERYVSDGYLRILGDGRFVWTDKAKQRLLK